MKSPKHFGSFIRTYLAIGATVSILAIYQTQMQTEALVKFKTRYKWVLLMGIFAAYAAAGLYIALTRREEKPFWERWKLGQMARPMGIAAGVALVLLPALLFMAARADFYGRGPEAFFRLLWLFWGLALLQAIGLRLATGLDWRQAMLAVLLLDGTVAQLRSLGAQVSDYPFSMGWSEASRYYYGSLVFSKSLYGETVPLSVMHGSRYLLQSVPFALGHLSAWGARLWQVFLWIGLTLWAAWGIVRRLAIRSRLNAVLLALGLFLFFFQGAVYYHLQVCVILIMLGVDLRRPWTSLAAVVTASLWAGMSRVNWFPVPAILAIALYMLEKPVQESRGLWQYLKLPIIWGTAGMVASLLGQALYIWVSGNSDLEAFASSFTSALLWYRWLPSPTNPIGIIPGVLIVSLPMAALLASRLRVLPGELHPIRLMALGGMLLLLLAGGLVVSTKIGGGGDLHNMDAYLVLLATIGAYTLSNKLASESGHEAREHTASWGVMLMITLVPVTFALLHMANPFTYDAEQADADLSVLRHEIGEHAKAGEVAFMYERHLLTFGEVSGVPLVPEYEVVTLMEMAISGNEMYLGQYYRDLEAHRFSAIVAHPQNLGVETGDFIEESDAWNRLVAQPLLCQYKPSLTLNYSKVQILVPRARPCLEFPPEIRAP